MRLALSIAASLGLVIAPAALDQTAEGRAVSPIEADVPKPAPVSVLLAGVGSPNISRFLMAGGPSSAAGEQDDFVTAIRNAEGTVAYRRYEGEGHILANQANIIDFNRAKAALVLEQFGMAH